MNKPNRPSVIACVSADSGGHIFPCLTFAQNQTSKSPESTIIFISADRAKERSFLATFPAEIKKQFLPHVALSTAPLPFIKSLWDSSRLFIKALYLFHRYKPSELITTGGAFSIPVCLAAWLLRIPITAFELNATPGKALAFIAPLVTTLYTCFPSAQERLKKYRPLVAPYPLRLSIPANSNRTSLLNSLELNPAVFTLLIAGGSQGSQFLNVIIEKLSAQHKELFLTIQLIHQTGPEYALFYQEHYRKLGVKAFVCGFDPRLNEFIQAADLVVSRAGAGTLFELLTLRKPTVTIPLITKQTDHQFENARYFSIQHPDLFTHLKQSEIEKDPSVLLNAITRLLANYRASYQDKIQNY